MSKRNVGQPIQQLDPFAIQVSQPSISIPSLPATKYYANTKDLEAISRSLSLIGQGAYQYARLKQGEKIEEERQERLDRQAEAGAGRQAATIDRAILKASFEDDTLDTTILRPADPANGVEAVTEEDELIRLVQENGPVEGLRDWINIRLSGPMSQLGSEEARQAYYEEAFPTVLNAGMAWVNAREQARQSMLREDLAIQFAASDDLPSVGELVSESKKSSVLEPLDEQEAVGLLLQSAEIASSRDRHDRARRLLGLIPESKRGKEWYEAADATETRFLDGAGRVITGELRSTTFAPGGPIATMFGPGTNPDSELIERLDQAIKSLAADQSFSPEDQRDRLLAAQAEVDPMGAAFISLGTAANRIEVASDETIQDRRKENAYQANLIALRLLTESVIQVRTDGKQVTIDLENPEADSLVLDHLVSKYGEDGRLYYDEYLQLKGQKRYTAAVAEPDQDAAAAALLEGLMDITSNKERDQYLRNEVVAAAKNGEITFAQQVTIIGQAKLANEMQPEFESTFFRETKKAIGQAFAAALGVEAEFDMLGNMSGLTFGKNIDPMAYAAYNKMIGGFRHRYTRWLSANMELRKEDPFAFRSAQDDWLMQNQDYFFKEAAAIGTQYSPAADDQP